jgi:GNAT superfamily N-acetyltransferase
MVKYKVVRGKDIPKEARALSRGNDGLMESWYDKHRDDLFATLLLRKGKLIGWCAVKKTYILGFETRNFEIGTFVQPYYRGKGYGKRLLDRTLSFLKVVQPNAKILYGAPSDHGYFNEVYSKTISSKQLQPDKYYICD